MKAPTALIADDEPLLRDALTRLLAQAWPELQVLAQARNGREAVEHFEAQQPDICFLDVHMPGLSGVEAAQRIGRRALIVFVTAYDQYAVQAFEQGALDYLVKPVEPERLAKTIARLRPPEAQSTVATLPMEHGLLLKFGESARIVRLREIERFESVGNHAAVYSAHGQSFVLSSLNRIEQRLDPAHFFRVNRSCILRLDAIRSLEPDVGQGLVARTTSGAEIEVSRRAAQQLRARMAL